MYFPFISWSAVIDACRSFGLSGKRLMEFVEQRESEAREAEAKEEEQKPARITHIVAGIR